MLQPEPCMMMASMSMELLNWCTGCGRVGLQIGNLAEQCVILMSVATMCKLQHVKMLCVQVRQVLLQLGSSLLQELHILTAPAAADIVPSTCYMYV